MRFGCKKLNPSLLQCDVRGGEVTAPPVLTCSLEIKNKLKHLIKMKTNENVKTIITLKHTHTHTHTLHSSLFESLCE